MRNTKWMYGVVIYAGHDTKLVQNSGMCTYTDVIVLPIMGLSIVPLLYSSEQVNFVIFAAPAQRL